MDKTGKILKIVAILFMGMTTAMNLLGGAGTSCVAFSSNIGYRMAFKELMDVRWIYQVLVVTTVLLGIAGIWSTVKLIRGGSNVYKTAVIILGIGTVLGAIHYFTSLGLRGKAAPANVKFYLNVITLLIFLALNLPGIRNKIDFSSGGSGKAGKSAAAGMAAMVIGIITLTVFDWAAPTHTLNGENWVYVFYTPLMVFGTAFFTGGIGTLIWSIVSMFNLEVQKKPLELSETP
jgi:hypothetical protein